MPQAYTFRSTVTNGIGPLEIRIIPQRPYVSSHTLLSHQHYANRYRLDIFDEYARRQYQAKAPQRNPFGDEEEPNKFADLDVFTKIRVLHQLSIWTFNNPNPIREKMTELDETQWVSIGNLR